MSMVDYTRDTMKNGLIQFGECHKTMSSLEIAEVIGKPHNDIMKAIRKMEPAWTKLGQGNFSQSSYINKQGKHQPCFELTKTECLYIATKFNDEARAKLVLRWEALETGQAQPMFQQPKFEQIRTAGTADNPLFCLADVCKSLELHSNVVRQRLTDDVCSTYPIVDSIGRTQQATFITEDGLYDVILDSRKPEAKAFRKWVTSEVLPSIRKTGSYSIKNLSRKELALMVIQAEEENERLALENKPKVVFADAIVGSQSGCKSIR